MDTRKHIFENFIPISIGSILGANLLTMSLMNFLESNAREISLIYAGTFLLAFAIIAKSGVTFPKITKRAHILSLLLGLALFLPRIQYLLESAIGYSVNAVCFDDWWHLQELSSIVHTEKFPPRSTFDSDMYLRYYYAPWILGAALYWTGLFLTVKQAMGAMVLIYCVIFAYCVSYSAKILFTEDRHRLIYLACCIFYGGFDFLYSLSNFSLTPVHSEPPMHSEWWAYDFGFVVQFSNFFTLALHVQQHLVSAASILYGLYVVSNVKNVAGQIAAGILFAAAFFSSVFTTIGAVPLIAWFFLKNRLKPAPLVMATALILSLPLLWILVGSGPQTFKAFGALNEFWMEHKSSAFIAFLFVVSLELLPLLVAAGISTLHRVEFKWLYFSSLLFLISTFFISHYYSPNYSMRGAIVPIFILIYLSIPTFSAWLERGRWLPIRILAAAYLLGGILEYASFSLNSALAFRQSRTSYNADVLSFNAAAKKPGSDLAERAKRYEFGWYLIERNTRKSELVEDDRLTMITDNRYRVTLARLLENELFRSP